MRTLVVALLFVQALLVRVGLQSRSAVTKDAAHPDVALQPRAARSSPIFLSDSYERVDESIPYHAAEGRSVSIPSICVVPVHSRKSATTWRHTAAGLHLGGQHPWLPPNDRLQTDADEERLNEQERNNQRPHGTRSNILFGKEIPNATLLEISW